jgi:4-hydroxy-3-polyprenylbenzoate decarboxylase
MFTKIIVVVDEDVDVQSTAEILWRVGNNVDFSRDVLLTEGPVDVLDHAGRLPNIGGKLGIDATRKWPEEGYVRDWPDDIVMSPEVRARIDAIWGQLGLDG